MFAKKAAIKQPKNISEIVMCACVCQNVQEWSTHTNDLTTTMLLIH